MRGTSAGLAIRWWANSLWAAVGGQGGVGPSAFFVSGASRGVAAQCSAGPDRHSSCENRGRSWPAVAWRLASLAPLWLPVWLPRITPASLPRPAPCRNPWVVPVVNLGPRCRQRNAARDSCRRRHERGRTPTVPMRHDSQTVLQPASEFGLESAGRSASARGDPCDPWCPGQARCRPGERSGPRSEASSGCRR
jgi:hypothetical protein